jgi:hypothetical protein
MHNQSSNAAKPYPNKLAARYRNPRTHMLQAAASADAGTVRATLAYVALWLLSSLAALAYITHLSALFR